METINGKKSDYNFNEKCDSAIEKYEQKGGTLILKVEKDKIELLMIAAREGLNSFKKQAKKQNYGKYIFETIEELSDMAKTLEKITKDSEITIKFVK